MRGFRDSEHMADRLLMRALPGEWLPNTSLAAGQLGRRAGKKALIFRAGIFEGTYEENDPWYTLNISGAGSGPSDCPEASGPNLRTRVRLQIAHFLLKLFCKCSRQLARLFRHESCKIVTSILKYPFKIGCKD